MASDIFLSLGSNIGNRFKYLLDAIKLINENCPVKRTSSVYETLPYGNIKQDNYYNAVLSIETNFKILELFNFLKEIEQKVGRKKSTEKWAPREIDIDILFYNNVIYSDDMLTVPHRDILNRDFVLIPLKEICGNFVHPVLGVKIKELDLSLLKNHIVQKVNYKPD